MAHNERELLAYMAPDRTMKERCEYLAPLVKEALKGIEPELNTSTADLCDDCLMPTTHKQFPVQRKACMATLYELSKGQLRNWRTRGEPNGRKYMGRTAYTQIWHDEKYCAHPVTGLDPSARKPAEKRVRIEPFIPESYPYLDTLRAAWRNGTAQLLSTILHVAPMILADVPLQYPMPFSHLVDHMVPRDVSPHFRSAIYDLLKALSVHELKRYTTSIKLEANGRKSTHLVWHRAKNIEPATTE